MSLKDQMQHSDKPRSGLALGGLGTGWFELRKDGIFRNWNIFNNDPWGTGPRFPHPEDSMLFFIVRYQEEGENPKLKLLQIDEGYDAANIPSHIYYYPWLSGIQHVDYTATFPFSKLVFTDPEMPLRIELEAFSPFIPHDVKNSALPVAFFNFRVRSLARKPIDVMLLASMRNAVGYDVPDRRYVTRTGTKTGWKYFELACEGMSKRETTYGTQCVASVGGKGSHYVGWEHRHPYYEVLLQSKALPNVDDTAGRNVRDKKTGKVRAAIPLFGSIARSERLARGKGFDHSFVVTWNFPNLYARKQGTPHSEYTANKKRLEGHYYSRYFSSALDVADYSVKNRKSLEKRTRHFHQAFYDSTAPDFVLDQVNSHLNTFVTSSWLTKEGHFGIQEGMTPAQQWGPLATMDVSMYGSVCTAALFPELDRQMMRDHARFQDKKTGEVCHGIQRDFSQAEPSGGPGSRLDMPSQFVVLALRNYFWTQDRTYLREIWPNVVRALEYVLRDRDQNGDLLPDMTGIMCTYDNFPMHGAASFVASTWLAALRHATEAARHLGDHKAAERYEEIFGKALPVFEKKLWNGEYYVLFNDEGGQFGDRDEGCLTDQIIGQWGNQLTGLGGLLEPKRVRKALRSIMKRSYQPGYGLRNCSWPEDGFYHPIPEDIWVDQANTCWTGVELAFASLLIYEGLCREGLQVIKNVDDRYRKAGLYFDHQEFGGHYFRPMSAWSILHALIGLQMVGDRYAFAPRLPGREQKLFFAFHGGWGHYSRSISGRSERVRITPDTGTLRCKELRLGCETKRPSRVSISVSGTRLNKNDYVLERGDGEVSICLTRKATLRPGQSLSVNIS